MGDKVQGFQGTWGQNKLYNTKQIYYKINLREPCLGSMVALSDPVETT